MFRDVTNESSEASDGPPSRRRSAIDLLRAGLLETTSQGPTLATTDSPTA
jgi:hypothetical protein